jgi:deoxyribonuclease V
MNLFDYTYNLVRQIPDGQISSYGAVADALGDIIASRAVGRMMNQNPDADDMPCYKIVHSDGRLGGFGLGFDNKIKRLNDVGIIVKKGKIIDFEQVFFNNFQTKQPLKILRKEQIKLSKKIKLEDDFTEIETIAGIDVAYPKSEFEKACGACVIIDYKTKEVIDERVAYSKTNFPYISTYLTYREKPIIEKLMKEIKIKPTVFMFDGNGILHPYGLGLASHIGVIFNISSIGIAKSLLYGDVNEDFVSINGEKRGYCFYSSNKIKNPIYVSPGNNISFETSLKIVKNLCKFKLPEPIRLAHNLAKTSL